jgi:cyclic pyranopterin phosphate synthase
MTHKDGPTDADEHNPLSTHLDARGQARMVDVGEKQITARRAVATARVRMSASTAKALADNATPKGDVLATARIAGIQAAKRTPELIPLCHVIALTKVRVDFELSPDGVLVTAVAEARDRTGVEMEALTAATVASLTVYDMLKGVDRAMSIEAVRLEEKEGGRSGRWVREAQPVEGALPVDRTAFVLTREKIDVAAVRAKLEHPSVGAICLFHGIVRDHNDGKAVSLLEYEAYDAMVLSEMRRIGEELQRAFPGVRLAATHRVGSLAIGDDAIVCAASAAHRGPAFEAGKRLIDEIKARVPIWKREHGADGAYWVGWEDARITAR